MSPTGQRINGVEVAKARLAITDKKTGKPLTQAAFAKRLGIHFVTMSNIENGKANVSLEMLERIAKETRRHRDDFLLADDEDDLEAAQLPDHRQMLELLHGAIGIALQMTKPTASLAKATVGSEHHGG
jgi:transcriptional regulator with XRE-family HTH domain